MANSVAHEQPFDRTAFESLLKRRLFFTEAFEIYRRAPGFEGDNRGLYDYGPPGCGLQANIVELWRKHFVLEEDMLEVDCTVLTPEEVFKTSGHVAKFADWMCKDPVNGDHLRADHLVENVLEARLEADEKARGVLRGDVAQPTDAKKANKKSAAVEDHVALKLDDAAVQEYQDILAQIDNFDGPELGAIIKRLDIRNPKGNGEVQPPTPFNLMFKSSIGPSTAAPVYLRPETAQGQFLNFRKLLEYNGHAMPFASASVGRSYRNEISPRSGLLRVREFLMAEIEHYVDPQGGKKHDRFSEVNSVVLPLLDRSTQLSGKTEVRHMSIEEAVESRVIDNETLGYFLARINAFLSKLGVDSSKLRFRQHLPNEMAHYACDCWDAELLTSHGWIECVGCADRSAYDLTVHMRRTGERLVVQEPLKTPVKVTEWRPQFDKKFLGRIFKRDAKAIETVLSALPEDELIRLSQTLANVGQIELSVPGLADKGPTATLTHDMVKISQVDRIETVREYTPNVIEPSFGIGRILYSLLEHVYWRRPDDVARAVLSLPLSVAPTKVLLVPLSNRESLIKIARQISYQLRSLGISNRIDSSGASIGKRYSRNDELGIPLGITVDFETEEDGSVTLRERDSTTQVRASQLEIVAAVRHLVDGNENWADVSSRLPQFTTRERDTE